VTGSGEEEEGAERPSGEVSDGGHGPYRMPRARPMAGRRRGPRVLG
jgi:hypothetical protein